LEEVQEGKMVGEEKEIAAQSMQEQLETIWHQDTNNRIYSIFPSLSIPEAAINLLVESNLANVVH
jgi:hypothetical protein